MSEYLESFKERLEFVMNDIRIYNNESSKQQVNARFVSSLNKEERKITCFFCLHL